MTPGKMVRNEIKQRGLTINAVSDRTGVKYQSLQRFTSGRGDISIYDYLEVCRFLGLDPLGDGGLDLSTRKYSRAAHDGDKDVEDLIDETLRVGT